MIIGSIYTISNIGVDIYEGEYKLADAIVSIIIEFSAMITLIELIDAALTLRKLRDKQKLALEKEAADSDAPPDLAESEQAQISGQPDILNNHDVDAADLEKTADAAVDKLEYAADKATEQVKMEAEDTAEQLRQVEKEAADE